VQEGWCENPTGLFVQHLLLKYEVLINIFLTVLTVLTVLANLTMVVLVYKRPHKTGLFATKKSLMGKLAFKRMF